MQEFKLFIDIPAELKLLARALAEESLAKVEMAKNELDTTKQREVLLQEAISRMEDTYAQAIQDSYNNSHTQLTPPPRPEDVFSGLRGQL